MICKVQYCPILQCAYVSGKLRIAKSGQDKVVRMSGNDNYLHHHCTNPDGNFENPQNINNLRNSSKGLVEPKTQPMTNGIYINPNYNSQKLNFNSGNSSKDSGVSPRSHSVIISSKSHQNKHLVNGNSMKTSPTYIERITINENTNFGNPPISPITPMSLSPGTPDFTQLLSPFEENMGIQVNKTGQTNNKRQKTTQIFSNFGSQVNSQTSSKQKPMINSGVKDISYTNFAKEKTTSSLIKCTKLVLNKFSKQEKQVHGGETMAQANLHHRPSNARPLRFNTTSSIEHTYGNNYDHDSVRCQSEKNTNSCYGRQINSEAGRQVRETQSDKPLRKHRASTRHSSANCNSEKYCFELRLTRKITNADRYISRNLWKGSLYLGKSFSEIVPAFEAVVPMDYCVN